jgi:hypothetical protein
MQNPTAIKPEIGKLSKSIVDSIPLVNYIPAPPLDDTGKETLSAPQLYPPKPTKQRMRFRLLQNFTCLTSRFSSDEIEFCAPNTLGSSFTFLTSVVLIQLNRLTISAPI